MKQFLSILLSLILLVSHINLIMGTHLCGGEAVETKIMLGETYLGCDMMDMEETCENADHSKNNQASFENIPCCQNEFQTIQGTDDYVKDAVSIVFYVEFSVTYIYSMLNMDLFSRSTTNLYSDFIPPPVEKDVQVLFQTFLL